MTNYYHVLGLSEDASHAEIKSAFKRLAVKYHPDKHPNDPSMEEKFKEINLAHQILSDEYQKARFDLKLKYRQFDDHHTRTYQAPNTDYWKNKSRVKYAQAPIDYRKNAIATAYAFGISFLIALVVMTGLWAKEKYDDYKLEVRLAERRSSYVDAKKHFEAGEYFKAFEIMNSLQFFRKEEWDMKVFKNTMMDQIIDEGNYQFASNNYHKSIELYELVKEFAPDLSFYEAWQNLSEAYMHTGQPEKALQVMNEYLVGEVEIFETLVKIARIQNEELNQPEEALDHLLLAHRLAVKRYKSFYGEGYPLVINEKHVPASHFYMYTYLANIYNTLGDHNMAIKASDWNKYVWPDSAISYITSAEAHLALGREREACIEYGGAKDRGWTGQTPSICR